MRATANRLRKLEQKLKPAIPLIDVILITEVSPGPNGPIDHGPIVADILTGPNAGIRLHRDEGESTEAFKQRVDLTLAGESQEFRW